MHINFQCNLQAEASHWDQWDFDPCSKQRQTFLPWAHLFHHTLCYLFPSFQKSERWYIDS